MSEVARAPVVIPLSWFQEFASTMGRLDFAKARGVIEPMETEAGSVGRQRSEDGVLRG